MMAHQAATRGPGAPIRLSAPRAHAGIGRSLSTDRSPCSSAALWRARRRPRRCRLINPSDGSRAGADRARQPRPTSTPRWPRPKPRSTAPGAGSAPPSAAASCCASSQQVLEQVERARARSRRSTSASRSSRAAPTPIALARYLEFYGGAADKVTGETHALRRRLHRADAARAARRHRPHRAVELPDADRRPQRRCRAGDGQRLRPQARRGSLPHGAGVRAHRARGRPAGRRAQRRARARRGGRRGAGGAPWRRSTCRSPARWRSARWSRPRPPRTRCR